MTGALRPPRRSWIQRAWRRFRRGRPKASAAQAMQAGTAVLQLAVTAGLFWIAYEGLFFNVLPTWTLKTAQEEAAQLRGEARDLREEIAKRKAEIDRYEDTIRRNDASMARYQTITRHYVIDQFSQRMLSLGEPLLGSTQTLLDWGTLVVSMDQSPYRSVARSFDFTKKISPFASFMAPSVTGRELIESNLDGPELALLDGPGRLWLVESVKEEIARDRELDATLVANFVLRPDVAFGRDLYGTGRIPDRALSLEDRDEKAASWRREVVRVRVAHLAFVVAIERLRRALRDKA